MSEIVVADLGGTHARFALAEVVGGRVVSLGTETVIRTADHASLQTAWQAFAAGRTLPNAAAFAVACPVGGPNASDVLRFTNSSWTIHPALLSDQLGVEHFTVVNDFAAVAYAVASVDHVALTHLCGPDRPVDPTGVITVFGPGTGLGVALLIGGDGGEGGYRVVATEGGHIDFAPLDAIDDAILARLRASFGRVSVERVVAGPGLVDIHAVLAAIEGCAVVEADAATLWATALGGDDGLAAAALDRFCLCLGAIAGDLTLAQGGFGGVVIAGGVGLRLAGHLPRSGFAQRFVAKGRFEGLMRAIPVKILTHPQPGLFGAAAAFAQQYPEGTA